MKKAEALLRDALSMTGMVIPLTSGGRGGKVEFLCRQILGQEARWLGIVEGLLRWGEQDLKDKLFIARRYLLKDNKMVFGWFLSIEKESVRKLDEAVVSLVECMVLLQKEQADIPVSIPFTKPQNAPRPIPGQKPNGPKPSIRVVSSGVDDDGRKFEVTEMPLPHLSKDINAPQFEGSTKGAFLHGKAPFVGRKKA